uniref:Peptidase C58 YopT-type domain-containing protein n=1 Tax=viral metagenome TaxID=1070528 RepID=A0A6C0ADT4_9ZZZZ
MYIKKFISESMSTFSICFILRSNIFNMQNHSEGLKKKQIYINNYKKRSSITLYSIPKKLRSKNFIQIKEIEFNEKLFLKMDKYINFFDYISNLDIMFNVTKKLYDLNHLNSNIRYYICKRKYESSCLKEWCFKMSLKLIKEMLSNNLNSIDFTNGPDDESKSYQLLQYDMIINIKFLLSLFVDSFDGKLQTEIRHEEIYKKIGLKCILKTYSGDRLNDGVYLCVIYEGNSGHATVLQKNNNNYLFFDPNFGLMKMKSIESINKFMLDTYLTNNVKFYKIVPK